jgi:hypothetical protein
MADALYLSLWYPSLRLEALGDKLARVLLAFKNHGGEERVYSASVWPVSWSEPPVFQRIYRSVNRVQPQARKSGPQLVDQNFGFDAPEPANPLGELKVEHGIDPPLAIAEALENLHDDYAYEFQIGWSLWEPAENGGWARRPRLVSVTGFGPHFDSGIHEQEGHIRIGFGNDAPFLEEEIELDEAASRHIEENLRQLIELVRGVEKASGAAARLLWSEMGESLALRLIERLNERN